jgi:hypothetical protein
MTGAVKTPVTGAVAVYVAGEDRLLLPIVGLDASDQALVLGREGRVVLATKARPRKGGRSYNFEAVEVAS